MCSDSIWDARVRKLGDASNASCSTVLSELGAVS